MKYLVTPAPHKYAKMSTADMYVYTSIALILCFLYGAVKYQLSSLIIVASCAVPVVLIELIVSSIKNKKVMLQDASCFVTALTLACIMPINMPWYLGILAAVITVAIKYLFGGVGNNLFNSSALGRSIVGCLFTGFSFELFGASPTILQSMLSGETTSFVMQDILMGNVSGAVGTTCILMILISAVVLMVLKVVRWESLLFAVAGFVTIVWILMGANNVLPMLCSGSFMFVCVFMLSDPTTSPYNFSARSIFALLFGVLSGVMMKFNIMGETAVFLALLICNFIAPALDTIFSAFKKGVKNSD